MSDEMQKWLEEQIIGKGLKDHNECADFMNQYTKGRNHPVTKWCISIAYLEGMRAERKRCIDILKDKMVKHTSIGFDVLKEILTEVSKRNTE